MVTTAIVLTRLRGVASTRVTGSRPAWRRRCWLAAAVVAPAVVYLEPIRSNFEFGQINVVLMTLVIADCVPRKTPWPRGLLLGVAIALKLTPAVFLLYFLLRRDTRALLVTRGRRDRGDAGRLRAGLARLLAVLDRDGARHRPHRHCHANTNQNIAGTLARLGIGETPRFVIWLIACFAVLGLTVWAAPRCA